MAGIRDRERKPFSNQHSAALQRAADADVPCHVRKCHDVARFA
jgi:hypothetical protein